MRCGRLRKGSTNHRFVPSEVHGALAELPFSLILTTCQDDLMAMLSRPPERIRSFERYNFRGDRRDNPEFPLPSSPQAPLVYHLFGDAQEPGSLVLSENDLLDFLIVSCPTGRRCPAAWPRAQAGRPELSVRRFRHHAVVSPRAVEGAGAIA